jgi:hypothetical protein
MMAINLNAGKTHLDSNTFAQKHSVNSGVKLPQIIHKLSANAQIFTPGVPWPGVVWPDVVQLHNNVPLLGQSATVLQSRLLPIVLSEHVACVEPTLLRSASAGLCPGVVTCDTGLHSLDSPICAATVAIDIWDTELQGDMDHDFIIAGLKDGFRILDAEGELPPMDRRNYKSTSVSNSSKMEQCMKEEMVVGYYIKLLNHMLLVLWGRFHKDYIIFVLFKLSLNKALMQ